MRLKAHLGRPSRSHATATTGEALFRAIAVADGALYLLPYDAFNAERMGIAQQGQC
jgi:hypothetical protein